MKIYSGGPVCHIANAKLAPESSMSEPLRFENLADAIEFSRITRRIVWATVGPDIDLFRCFPGGRIYDYSFVAKKSAVVGKSG